MKMGTKKKNKMVSGKPKKRKKIVMKRKPKKEQQMPDTPIKKPWGGHLPFPPDNCPKKEHVFISENVPWIDLGICLNCPDYPKGCDRKQNYLKEMKIKKEK